MITANGGEHCDLLGVGFGPSHLSLCAVLASRAARPSWRRRTVRFLEETSCFAWHPGMLLDGARVQVAFLKDLITAKDPTSPFTFVSYLHEQGRLQHFVNLRSFHPSRRELNGYFAWAAGRFEHHVSYGRRVERVAPLPDPDGSVTKFEVTDYDAVTGRRRRTVAANVSLAVGGRPFVPDAVAAQGLDDVVFHSDELLMRLEALRAGGVDAIRDVLVVGAGQSAAEAFRRVAADFPDARVTLAFRSFALMPANSSPLVNEIFHPEMVDGFHALPEDVKAHVLETLRYTNYAAVDDELIQEICELLYEQRIDGTERLRLRRFSDLVGCRRTDRRVRITLRDACTGELEEHAFDAAVLATGYDFGHVESLLAELGPYLRRGEDGALKVRRDYSIETHPALRAKVFLLGATEATHGLTSTLLSVLPHRAVDILEGAFGSDPETDRPRAVALALEALAEAEQPADRRSVAP